MQTTQHLLMIRPARFEYNAQTAANNAFQQAGDNQDAVAAKALQEFDDFVAQLRQAGVHVTVVQDSAEPRTPDSIFPNNWVSFHADGTVILYPMWAPNRRLERKPQVLQTIGNLFNITNTIDYSHNEANDVFLEGTGSMVLDRQNRLAYACLSARTDEGLLQQWCAQMQYRPVVFTAVDEQGGPIYHTNVMMCVADKYVVICLECIPNLQERERVAQTITAHGQTLVPISYAQMNQFAGNMLQVHNAEGQKLLVMSSQAYHSLTPEQLTLLQSFNPIVHSPLTTIETNGGGSARCMMAEVHLPAK
ncbi:MAG TPA: arginine deiminase-related protein [Phnomibacter sp.]|nr:arginine deiminase-related protein [Phnomibacter sp.]